MLAVLGFLRIDTGAVSFVDRFGVRCVAVVVPWEGVWLQFLSALLLDAQPFWFLMGRHCGLGLREVV